MNKKELRELDAWIAENVFGWSERVEIAKGRSLKSCGQFEIGFKKFDGMIGDYSSHVTRDGEKVYCGRPFQFRAPHYYATSPGDAMDVLEKCEPLTDRILINKTATWNIWCESSNHGRNMFIEAKADTLPLAICLFAKKLFSKP